MVTVKNGSLLTILCAVAISGLAATGFAQGRYTNLNITKIITTSPREAQCYDTRTGHYPCIEIGVVIVHRNADGSESSISTAHRIDGAFVSSIRTDFGSHSGKYFEALKKTWNYYNKPAFPTDLHLPDDVRAKLTEFIDLINQFESGIDLAVKPDDLYNQMAIRALYEVTEGFLHAAGVTPDEQRTFVTSNVNTGKTLVEIARKGLDLPASLIPFVNDARDLYELVVGRDLITGESIDSFGRFLTGVALIAGNGNIYRKAADKLKEGFLKKTIKESAGGIPGLTYTGAGSWKSAEGLVYRRATEDKENRLRHILRHTTPDPSKPAHTVFAGNPKEVPALIDQAWKMKGAPLLGDAGAYVIDMGRTIGTMGERKIRIVVVKGTSSIITAYPN